MYVGIKLQVKSTLIIGTYDNLVSRRLRLRREKRLETQKQEETRKRCAGRGSAHDESSLPGVEVVL